MIVVGVNSGQTSIKWLNLPYDVEPLVKNCKGLTLKLKIKYLFPTLSSGPNYIYQLLEYLEMRKML